LIEQAVQRAERPDPRRARRVWAGQDHQRGDRLAEGGDDEPAARQQVGAQEPLLPRAAAASLSAAGRRGTRKELDQMVEELGGSTSELTIQRSERKRSRSASGPVTLFRKGSIFLITKPARTGDHTQEGRRYAVVVTATNFIGSVVTVAPTSTSARPSLTRPEAEIDGRKCRILLEQMLGVDVTKLNNWMGVLDDGEKDALDDALRLYHGLL
jgi:mRNA interferase MazF